MYYSPELEPGAGPGFRKACSKLSLRRIIEEAAMRCDQVAGFILAGGSSSRMGRDKASLEIDGVPLLVRAARLLDPLVRSVTVIGAPERYASLGLPIVPDDQPSLGPLGGIATALRITPTDWNLVVACDLPYLNAAWVEHLVARGLLSLADVLLPATKLADRLRAEPLCAMYHNRSRLRIAAALAQGIYKIADGLAGLRVDYITPAEWKAFDSDGRLFKNMNAPADYEEARARLEGKPTK